MTLTPYEWKHEAVGTQVRRKPRLPMTTWSTSNTSDWTPTVPSAQYQVGVRVRGKWNTAGTAEFVAIQPFVIQ